MSETTEHKGIEIREGTAERWPSVRWYDAGGQRHIFFVPRGLADEIARLQREAEAVSTAVLYFELILMVGANDSLMPSSPEEAIVFIQDKARAALSRIRELRGQG